MKKLFKNKWITLFFLLITLNSFSIRNNEIETKIRIFENGLINKDVDMVMSVFDKNALWENTPTYYLFKRDLLNLFDYYKTINLHRINLKITENRGYIISKAGYLFDTEVNTSGVVLKQNITFILLWEKKNNDWKIISTNLPTFKKYASDITNFDFSSEIRGITGGTNIGINNNTISHSALQNALGKPCASNKVFIRSLYQSILERDLNISLSPGHGAAHLKSLQNGDSRWAIILSFFNSPEYKNKHKSHRAFIRDVYQAVLAREPQENEINTWPQINRQDIILKFINSDEYKNILKNCPKHKQIIKTASLKGKWKLNQNNGYTGIMNLQKKSNNHYSGNVIWNGYLKGTVDGQILGNKVSITVDYHNGDIGYYSGTLSSNGNSIVKGTLKGNNGVSAKWSATKVISHPIYDNRDNIWVINASGNVYSLNGANWDNHPGKAQDIGVGAHGDVWIVGLENHKYGSEIYHFTDNQFQKVPGQAVRLDVDPNGNPWVVNKFGQIFKWDNGSWRRLSGGAIDIGIGAHGAVWIIGRDSSYGGYGIYRWMNNQWVKISGAAVRIDVDPAGIPWIINAFNDIFKWDGNNWQKLPGKAKDISIATDGTPWIIGTNSVLGGYGIYKWNGHKWLNIPGGATVISAGGKN